LFNKIFRQINDKEIADKMFASVRTVADYRDAIFEKDGLNFLVMIVLDFKYLEGSVNNKVNHAAFKLVNSYFSKSGLF